MDISFQNIWMMIIIAIFCINNILIIVSDIKQRTIPNKYLVSLFLLLPFWLSIFPTSSGIILGNSILSLLIVIIGITFYHEDTMLGSGDFKYAAILCFFIGDNSIRTIVGNIGVLTIGILILWWSILCGTIYALRSHIPRNSIISIIKTAGRKQNIIKIGLVGVLDWIVIGYIFKEITQVLMQVLYGIDGVSKDIYFLTSIGVFLIRGPIRNYIFEGKYRKLSIIGIITFFLYKIHNGGLYLFLIDLYLFTQQIWLYAIIFMGIYIITSHTFKIYDSIINDLKIENSPYKTIPYSIIIFFGFCISYIYEPGVMNLVKSYL